MNDKKTFQIVVGVDGSQPSHRALEWAITEARLRDGHLRVVTGWRVPAATVDQMGTAREIEAVKHLAHQQQHRALIGVRLEGVNVTREVHEGSAAAVLLNASQDADLLVVGSHGYGGLTAALLGSVSNHIAHHAPCPVLIVRPRPHAVAHP